MSILLLLQTRDRVTAQEVARLLEVSVRTVYRDMESLSAAGIPVYGEPGHEGGYRLLGGFRTRLNGLTADEADSLFLTGLPGAAADLGLGAVVAATQLKVMSALPDELRDRAGRLAARFHLDSESWYSEHDSAPHLSAVANAVWHERRLHLRYLRWEQPQVVTRTLDPLGLVLKAGQWYLVAAVDGRVRTYRISRIIDLRVLDETACCPADFELTGYWREYLESFDRRRLRQAATLRMSPLVFDRMPEYFDPAVVQAARESAGAPDAHGWREITLPIESVDRAVPDVLRLGAGAEVLAPNELRERIAEHAGAMGRIYRA
ncbi:putative DNA-binding transcriptional regulator YafY [Nocardia tenerifensis]|uniref:Putative DNA-binding transcriptional regulator YafY n=2 Tax=Nocardia tenerifensis TaxID=228006 RepID=A0A318JLW5_9NOCA|nr:putative DNA-binding transcriptional regulator YafY [Nocardia tenerifensis]